jgi:hypothetical protein
VFDKLQITISQLPSLPPIPTDINPIKHLPPPKYIAYPAGLRLDVIYTAVPFSALLLGFAYH